MFAREPMERLVSAFHRLLNTDNVLQENYETYTRPILNQLRYNGTNMMPINGKAAWKMVRDSISCSRKRWFICAFTYVFEYDPLIG